MSRDDILDKLSACFECKRCGHCCIDTQFIKLTEHDIAVIGVTYGLERDEFVKDDICPGSSSEPGTFIKRDSPCQFYDASLPGCTIYDHRPHVCRDFPLEFQKCNQGPIFVISECVAMPETFRRYNKSGKPVTVLDDDARL